MGTDYNDLMTANPYHTFDANRASYGFQPSMWNNFVLILIGFSCFIEDLYDEMAATSAYCPPPTSHPSAYPSCPSMHPSSFFAAAAAAAAAAAVGNNVTSISHGISPSSYHGQETGE